MKADALLWLVNALQVAGTPLLLLSKWKRWKRRHEKYEWDPQRWNCPFPESSEQGGPHVVFVAMGFAETRMSAQVSNRLQEHFPHLRVTFAIRNRAAAEAGGALPKEAHIAPMPFDFALPVKNWLRNGRPDVVVLVERFWFANLVRVSHDSGALVAAIAAHTRDQRAGKYRWSAWYHRWILQGFDLICLRSEEEKLKFGPALPSGLDARVTGSLKFWPEVPPLALERREPLEAWLALAKDRPIFAAGSTQPGDEQWVLEAFAPLQERGAVLLLAPRNPPRADEVETLVRERGWRVQRRSTLHETGETAPDVLLLDTVGELTTAYGACVSAFVGGTLKSTGHNVLEPVAHGRTVFFGPKRGTFGAEQDLAVEAGVGFRVQQPEELTAGWLRLLDEPQWRRETEKRAQALNEQGKQAWELTVGALSELVERAGRR